MGLSLSPCVARAPIALCCVLQDAGVTNAVWAMDYSVESTQAEYHPLLAALFFTRQAVIRATTTEDAAAQAVELVRGWLADVAGKKAA